MSVPFVHLRLHTEYSLDDSLIRIPQLIQAISRLEMPAIAITDQANLFAAIKFYQAAIAAGVKPLLGMDCWIAPQQKPKKIFRCTLLCQNKVGYQNLIHLASQAHLDNQSQPRILKEEWIKENNTGLIVLSGGREGDIGQALLADQWVQAQERLLHWLNLFPECFYIELQRTGREREAEYINLALTLAHQNNTPVVATNDIRFLAEDEFEAHEARICIQGGYFLNDPKRPKQYSPQQYLRSSEEMRVLFSDIPSAFVNTLEIAKRCNVSLTFDKVFLPNFSTPNNLSAETFLVQQAKQGLQERLHHGLHSASHSNDTETAAHWEALYLERLTSELTVINAMGFASYFLIVADSIRWTKKQGIPVGPGRGSGTGSLVSYSLSITDIDPLKYDLLFERFLNPERISMPDFDIDFCMEGRDRVIEYVMQRYGRETVAQIITFGSMAARAVLRDVGRVLGYPYGLVDKIAKLIPLELGITLDKALEQEKELKRLYQEDEEIKTLIDLAQTLEGLVRNVSKHAGGVVIAPSKLTDFTPLYCDTDTQQIITQLDKDDIEKIGLVKFDFLGLRTLTIIDWAIKMVNQTCGQEQRLTINQIPLNDTLTFDLLKTCQTTAIFQLESRGMRDLIARLQPDCFEDIIALIALCRPGPLQSGMVEDFINRKHGRSSISSSHPLLEPILKPTYGIILYQEQIMQIAQTLADYSLGAADLLRRAIGKKKPEEMAKQKATFLLSAQKKKGVTAKLAHHIFTLIEKFADYGFNKAHAAAYALITYQTAWLKAHYPAEFMAAVLSSDMDHTEKIVVLLAECRSRHIKTKPPNINLSDYGFTVNKQGEIIHGLGALKGVGLAAVQTILQERQKHGPFQNFLDFCRRLASVKINRRTIEALIHSGSLDSLGMNRTSLLANLDRVLQAAEQERNEQACGQKNLFSKNPFLLSLEIHRQEQPITEQLRLEREIVGCYLSGHPIEQYEVELRHFITGSLEKIFLGNQATVLLAGWLVNYRTVSTKRGDRMALVTLEDRSAYLECTLFGEAYAHYQATLCKDRLIIAEADITAHPFDKGSIRVTLKRLWDLVEYREHRAKGIFIKVKKHITAAIPDLRALLERCETGRSPIFIEYNTKGIQARLRLGSRWKIRPTDEQLNKLSHFFGDNNVCMLY